MKRLFVLFLAICMIIPLASCGGERPIESAGAESDPTQGGMPEDFSFYVIWGVHGISSYYSGTGELTKTPDTLDGNKEKFKTTVKLDEERLKRFYDIITSLDLSSYPTEYDPGCGYSDPTAKLALAYTANGVTYTVNCNNISVDYRRSDNAKGQAFLDVVNEIADYLTSTPEWKALPDYELFYD